MGRRNLLSDYVKMRIKQAPSDRKDLPIVDKKDELVSQIDASSSDGQVSSLSQLNEFRTLADDRETQYSSYDEMGTDSVIAAALEIYADDATAYDEQGRVIWVESDDDIIAKAGNRLLDIFEIPERAWKHIYLACKYGDYYLKLYREGEIEDNGVVERYTGSAKVVNDKKIDGTIPPYEEYVEDVADPATMFDLRKKGKTAGFVEVTRDDLINNNLAYSPMNRVFSLGEVKVYKPDRYVHINISETMTRDPETVTLKVGDTETTYRVNRGKSILYDVYPVQRELQLLEDALLLNRLTRSSLIRLLEIEVGDMPKKEVNNFLRRMKNLIEQKISMDTRTDKYKSYNSPGPVDNVVYIPVRNGKGSISVNNLGGDVNVREIADIDYFNNKRAGALKIPRAYLGDDMDGSGLSNGGSLTRLSARYARTIKRIQTAYIRAITQLLNLFFIDKKLDYVNKFTVRMTSPSTQEDLERAELVNTNLDLVGAIMELMGSLEGSTQKKILEKLVSDIAKMPDIAEIIKEDETPSDEIDIEGGSFDGPDIDVDVGSDDFGGSGETVDISTELSSDSPAGSDEEFTDAEYDSFEDTL